jgi:hypothetical protein
MITPHRLNQPRLRTRVEHFQRRIDMIEITPHDVHFILILANSARDFSALAVKRIEDG